MSRKGTKIKDVARELGLTPRQLIERRSRFAGGVEAKASRPKTALRERQNRFAGDGRTEQAVRRSFDRTSTDQRAQSHVQDTTVSSPPPT